MDAMKERLHRVAAAAAVVACVVGCKGKSGGAAGAASAEPAAGAAAGLNPLAMLNGFEGEIDLAIKDMSKKPAPEVVPLTLQIKSDKVRAELPQSLGSKEVPK